MLLFFAIVVLKRQTSKIQINHVQNEISVGMTDVRKVRKVGLNMHAGTDDLSIYFGEKIGRLT